MPAPVRGILRLVRRRGGALVLLAAACLVASACGKKGPPLAPLRLVPAAPTEVSLRRMEDRARLQFVLPSGNVEGPGPVALDRVEIYAATVAPGAPALTDRDLLTNAYLVGEVAVRPLPAEGEKPAEGDARPAPGEVATFEEALTAAALTPVARPSPAAGAETAAAEPEPPPVAGAEAGQDAGPPKAAPDQPGVAARRAAGDTPEAAAAVPDAPRVPVRIYIVRGVTRGGRGGPSSARVELPLVPVPPPPDRLQTRVTETGVELEWAPPAGAASFNVYAADNAAQRLNPSALTVPAFEHAGARFGEEHCYRVRSVEIAGDVEIEGPASEPACVTPRDVFPPAAPRGLVAVPTPGQISLIWDAGPEADLAGYVVLRGDAPDGPLQAITATPIPETSYRDTAVTPGMRYVYAVVAVDRAEPPNISAESERVEETAR